MEDFFDVLKNVSSLEAQLRLKRAGEELHRSTDGHRGVPVAALASIALGAAGILLLDWQGAEHALIRKIKDQGLVERAMLAEAALTTMFNM